jgi:drug/metabolite transporter (DMT)-like permease
MLSFSDICPEIHPLKKIPLSIRYMLLSTFAFAFMNALIKYLIHFPTFELVFFRSLGTLVLTFFLLRSRKISLVPNQPKFLILRGVMGVTSMSLFFLGIHFIPIGSAVTIRYIAPLFGALLAIYFLKERIFPLQWFFYSVAFFGVVLIKGFDTKISLFGVAVVLGAAFFSAIVYIIISKIGKQDHPLLVVLFFMGIATLTGLIGSINHFTIPNGYELLLLLLLGFFGFFGQYYMTKAFQNGEVNTVAPIKYSEIVFTLSFGVYWFGEVYSLTSLIGIALVIMSLTLSVLYKAKKVKE